MMDRIKEHMKSLNEIDRLVLIRDSVNSTIKACKSKNKALKATMEYGFNRTGIRGGRFTTLNANLEKWSGTYCQRVDFLKELIKHI